tara:strand:- start:326 stop:1144 length:819 start_codon:yes stop_codon:yes gene_type:complete
MTKKLQPKIAVLRGNDQVGRYYYQQDTRHPDRDYIYSSTTIINNVLSKGEHFIKWAANFPGGYAALQEYVNFRAMIGTMTHDLTEQLLLDGSVQTTGKWLDTETGEQHDIPREVVKRLIGFTNFWKDHNYEVIATEIMLYDNFKDEGKIVFNWAGTADFIFRDKKTKKLCLFDLKTGSEHYVPQYLQLLSYKILWDFIYGREHGKIDEIGCLFIKNEKYKLKKYNTDESSLDDWTSVLPLFDLQVKNGRKKLPVFKDPDLDILPETITLEEK